MPTLSQEQIRKILPQEYPFVLIDYVEDYKEGEWLTAVKNITANEWPFVGRLKNNDIFPETLLIEAAAQAVIILYSLRDIGGENAKKKYYLGKVKADFFRQVLLGENIRFKVISGKLLDTGGYSNVKMMESDECRGEVQVFFSTKG